jgi:putative ABC transport system substrate-binding protein
VVARGCRRRNRQAVECHIPRQSPAPGFGEKYRSLSGFPSHSLESGGGAFLTVIFGQILAYSAFRDSHWTHNEFDRLPALAADLVRRQVTVIAAPGSAAAAVAAKAATATIPVVFNGGADPVQAGLVASLNRPGGNVTGVTTMNAEAGTKRLGLLHELLPHAVRFAVLVNPINSLTEPFVTDLRAAAAVFGAQIDVFNCSTIGEINTAFVSLAQRQTDALVVGVDTLFLNRRVQVATLAAHHRLPAIYTLREQAEVGGLMSYGSSFTDLFRQTGIYVGRVLKGEKPADLPVLRASKFEFVINLQTAKTLGLDVPPTLLARADEVIE